MPQLFAIGRVFATPGVQELMEQDVDITSLVSRHVRGDWGDMCEEDKAANARALHQGGRIFSSYLVRPDTKIWVITEGGDTTLLLPSEY